MKESTGGWTGRIGGPGYHGPYNFTGGASSIRDRLTRAMFNLVTVLSGIVDQAPYTAKRALPCKGVNGFEGQWNHMGHETPVSMTPAVQERLDALDYAIRLALADVCVTSKTRGMNVLLQLSSGEMSLEDYNDRVVKTNERLQNVAESK